MSNPSRQKGTAYEVLCRDYFQGRGWTECQRMATRAALDLGDLTGIPRFAIECRDRQKQELARNLDDAEERARNKGSAFGICLMKRPRRSVDQSYVLMSLDTLGRILDELLSKEKQLQPPPP